MQLRNACNGWESSSLICYTRHRDTDPADNNNNNNSKIYIMSYVWYFMDARMPTFHTSVDVPPDAECVPFAMVTPTGFLWLGGTLRIQLEVQAVGKAIGATRRGRRKRHGSLFVKGTQRCGHDELFEISLDRDLTSWT